MNVIDKPVTVLYRFYLKQQVRQLGHDGIFSSGWVKAAVSCVALLMMVTLTAIATIFYSTAEASSKVLDILLAFSNLTLPIWVTVGFIVSKVLLVNSPDLMSVTASFPVTNKQRGIAVLYLEATIAGLVTVTFFVPSLAPLLFIYGLPALGRIFLAIVFPGLILFLLAHLVFNLTVALASRLRMIGLSHYVGMAIVIGLAYLSALQIPNHSIELSEAYYASHPYWVWSNVLLKVYVEHGLAVAIGAFVIATATLLMLVRSTAPGCTSVAVKYVHLTLRPQRGLRRMTARRAILHTAVRNLVRARHTWFAVAASCAAFILLMDSQILPAALSLEIVSFMSRYLYSDLRRFRKMYQGFVKPWWEYLSLNLAMMLLTVPIGAIFLGIQALRGRYSEQNLFLVIGCLFSIPLLVTLGILLPTVKQNPLASLAAIGSLGVLLLATACALSIFSLMPLHMLGIAALLIATFVVVGIRALHDSGKGMTVL
ncbi:hypothetical protein GC425_04195 [Corynebacterium sp. zg254]|uniref:ABC-2 type transport system permease protein n=1 Tax=Corynebacterium zhongnanshanii TaxID=2768834 RepID=A0ABQ6VGD3_9CORY|nr:MULTISPECIES: hypothetical protein [Corynebacterium]KAB3522858.1 hypothetical protein F8377_01425 [Corynebacterium zhongnanshanii]MCR5914071.1 hypothetical protein [Corynebacterium sp. zg254]